MFLTLFGLVGIKYDLIWTFSDTGLVELPYKAPETMLADCFTYLDGALIMLINDKKVITQIGKIC